MSKKRLNLLPVWAAISAVIIIAGIVLMALLGFNDSLDRPESKNFDVYYNVVVDLSEERKATLEGYCEDAFAAQGIAYEEKTTLSGQTDPVSQNQSSFTGTGNDFVLRYTFSADVSDEALAAAKAAVEANIGGNQEFSPDYNGAETSVSYYTLELQAMNESVWRGAIAVAVGAIVALIYVAIRFGMGCALTGLVACVNDAFLAVWGQIPPNRPDPLRAYVCRIVRNLSLKKYSRNTAKKRNSFYDMSLDELAECIPAPDTVEARWDAKELGKLLDAFLGTLDRESRILFLRRYWFSQPLSQLASDFQITEHNAAVRLSRIRAKLKKYLLKEGMLP